MGDAARALVLTPSASLLQGFAVGTISSDGGHPRRSDPGRPPDAAALAAEATAVKERVDGWIADDLATSRVESGLVDGYFTDLRGALGLAMADEIAGTPRGILSGDPKKDFIAAWADGAKTYGAIGNPYAAGALPGSAPSIDGDTPLNRSAARLQGSAAHGLQQKLEQGRMLRDFADGKFGSGLVAILELRQGPGGALVSATLRESSLNPAFDAHVLRSAPRALKLLAAPPNEGLGIHPTGLSSVWRFEGHIVYKRRLRELHLARDGWYLAVLGLTGLATGSFDETTGEVELPDLRNPELRTTVRLLQVY